MKVAKILARIVLGLFGLAILLYLIFLAANWRDQPPSAAYQRLEQAVTARPRLPAGENAVVYLLGFSAPAGEDPREVGARRAAWLENFTAQTRPDTDPLPDALDLKANGSPNVERLGKECGDRPQELRRRIRPGVGWLVADGNGNARRCNATGPCSGIVRGATSCRRI